MKKMLAMAFAAVIAFGGSAVAQPLVDVAWLKANKDQPGVVVLDVQSPGAYAGSHIPGALNTDFAKSGWRAEKNGIPDMMNDPDKLASLIGSYGIDNATHVVLVPQGANAGEMGVATRIYWTLKVLGHDRVSVLNGGHGAWTADKANPVATGPAPQVVAKTFKASFRPELLATKDDVAKAIQSRAVALVDARPEDQYMGVNRNPKAKRNGTLPGAINVPNSWMTENNGGKFRDPDTIRKLYGVAGAPTSGQQIAFCNTGHLASVGWFVSSELLGNKQTKLYDGSMVEWTADPNAPVVQKITY